MEIAETTIKFTILFGTHCPFNRRRSRQRTTCFRDTEAFATG